MALRYLAPTQEQMRAAIETQVCPWCDRGPFRSLPLHTNPAHGIDRWQIRDYAGLTTLDRISSPELAETLREAKPTGAQAAYALIAAEAARGRRPPAD